MVLNDVDILHNLETGIDDSEVFALSVIFRRRNISLRTSKVVWCGIGWSQTMSTITPRPEDQSRNDHIDEDEILEWKFFAGILASNQRIFIHEEQGIWPMAIFLYTNARGMYILSKIWPKRNVARAMGHWLFTWTPCLTSYETLAALSVPSLLDPGVLNPRSPGPR
jgi:hypothetical protein